MSRSLQRRCVAVEFAAPEPPPTFRVPPPAMKLFRIAILAALAGPGALAAQVSTADEGSFTVTRRGETIGREEFRIVRRPAGGSEEFVAQAVGAYGDRRILPALQTDASGTPSRYQIEVRSAGASEQKLTGQLLRGRFTAQLQTPRGESAREYLVRDGVRIVDDDVYHQYYFLCLGATGAGADVPMLVPRRGAQGAWRVSRGAATESIEIGGRALQAQRLTLRDADGGTRELWTDSSCRLLKVSIPALGIVALRDDPPA